VNVIKGKGSAGRRRLVREELDFFFFPSSSLKSKMGITSVTTVTAEPLVATLTKAESGVTGVTIPRAEKPSLVWSFCLNSL
jgi:hypothetical protein